MSEMHENAAAYALSSLDAAELAEFETHLATCEICQQEVSEYCETAAELSLLTQAAPPPSLRANILAAIQQVPQLPAEDEADEWPDTSAAPIRRTSTDRRNHTTGPRRALAGSETFDELDSRAVDELALRRERRRNRILRGLVAALLIASVGLGGVVYTLVQQRQAAVVAAKPAFEEELLRAPDARFVVVDTTVGGRCTFIVSKQLNRALYLGTNMPDPGQGRHYQLWTLSNNDPDRDNPVPNVRPWRQFFGGDVARADSVAVSIERNGSTPEAPTDDPVAVAPLP